MASVSADVLENARSETMGLMLNQLKQVARTHKMPVSGAKAVLQERIKDKLSECARKNEALEFQRLTSSISDPTGTSMKESLSNFNTPGRAQAAYLMGGGPLSSGQAQSPGPVRPNFKDSPFFIIQSAVTPVQECKDPLSPFVKVDIAFPSQIEIKVNGNEVKANLRGLKNKPGSTRPADISDLIHKRPNYTNTMTVTYALTFKKFYLVVNLVNQVNPDRLVQELQMRNPILEAQVIKEMVNKSQDTDIQTTSSIMSLKCPLSTLRMQVPCRSTVCAHNQCYDATSFLQLQEQAPTWTCPVCSKPVSFESLHVDEYVSSILNSTTPSIDQVLVAPDGNWSKISSNESQAHGAHSSDDEDDDLIEINEPAKLSTRADSILTPSSIGRSPRSSREQSTAPVNKRLVGIKRPANAVIDLTFSSDEDDKPHAPKRQQTNPPALNTLRNHNSSTTKNSNFPHGNDMSFNIPS